MRRFVFAAFAVTVFAACQPASTELTDYQKAEIAAEVELLHGQFWDAWRAADVDRGLSYYPNTPEAAYATEGELFYGSAAVEDQATDRAFRIGQTRNVQVHKLVSLGTLEEKIDAMLTEKRSLADNIMDSTGAWVTELDTDALRELVNLSSDATIDDAD